MSGYPAPDLGSVLVEPTPGGLELEVPKDAGYYAAFNEFVGVVTAFYGDLRQVAGSVGIELPEVPEGDATELFIKPLSGDWNQIIGSGDAMAKAGTACREISDNLLANQVRLLVDWHGEAALAFEARLALHTLAYEAAGVLLEQAKCVFDAMAQVALLIGRVAIEILDEVLRLAVWLARQIPKRLGGAAAVATAIKDTVIEGAGWIKEIVDNIRGLVEAVTLFMDLVLAVEEWVASVPGQFEMLQSLGADPETLPGSRSTTAAALTEALLGIESRAVAL